ncbi:MAG TPA: DUF1232 domain-containing protein [Gaiellaceae bacterium]|nr:DUF1232 domain-containing protein [Gaiellaceae bacterium]
MTGWEALAACAGAALLAYALLVARLVRAGRAAEARALARLVPDLVVLCRRLLADPRLPRRRRLVLAALLPYLALPFDLVPDVVPVAGYLDDAVVVGLALRHVLRGCGRELIEEHWPGPPASLPLVLRLAGHGRVARGEPG